LISKKIRALWNPELYHGWGKSKKFFEGWYYKIVSKDEKHAFAIIPGLAMDENGNKQAFIQILDGKNNTARYIKFSINDFKANSFHHEVSIGDNVFKTNSINLNLPDIKGDLGFSEISPWSNSFFSPGIMGPFSFLPFMECYHGILSMNHFIKGDLYIKNEKIDFNKGKGYIEKDWGHSFPEAYLWMQTNHFSENNISLKASVAKIPWMGFSFIGFIAGVWFKGKLIEFTTYNFSKLSSCTIEKDKVILKLENSNYKIIIKAYREKPTELAAPIAGFMDSRIEESMNSLIELLLIDKKTNKTIIHDKGTTACIEVAGNHELLVL
jgi:tocopherol cyclase